MTEKNKGAEENVRARAQEDKIEEQTRPTREDISSYDSTKVGRWDSTGEDPGESSQDQWRSAYDRSSEQPSDLTRDTDTPASSYDLPTGDRSDFQGIAGGDTPGDDPRLQYGVDTGLADGGASGMGRLDPSNAGSGDHRSISDMGQGMISDRYNTNTTEGLVREFLAGTGRYENVDQMTPEQLKEAIRQEGDIQWMGYEGSADYETAVEWTKADVYGEEVSRSSEQPEGVFGDAQDVTNWINSLFGDPGPEGEQAPGSAPNLPEGFGGRGPSGGETINPGEEYAGTPDPRIIGELGQQDQYDMVGQPVGSPEGTVGGGPGSEPPPTNPDPGNIDPDPNAGGGEGGGEPYSPPSWQNPEDPDLDNINPGEGDLSHLLPGGGDEGFDYRGHVENVQEQAEDVFNPTYELPPPIFDHTGSDSGADTGGYDFTNLDLTNMNRHIDPALDPSTWSQLGEDDNTVDDVGV